MRSSGSGKRIDGNVVRMLRLGQVRSLRSVADQAGISPGELSKIERGLRPWTSPYIATKLAACLHVDPVAIARRVT